MLLFHTVKHFLAPIHFLHLLAAMNRLDAALRVVMRAKNIDQLTVASARCGIPQSLFSRIVAGKIGLSPENLRKVVTGISAEPEHQFTILRAHLFDEAEQSGFPLGLLKIEMENRPPDALSFAHLPLSLQYKLYSIGLEITGGDSDLEAGITWITTAIDQREQPDVEPRERFGVPEGKTDTSEGPLSSPVDAVILEQDKKHTAAPATSSSASSTPSRSQPTRPTRAKK